MLFVTNRQAANIMNNDAILHCFEEKAINSKKKDRNKKCVKYMSIVYRIPQNLH